MPLLKINDIHKLVDRELSHRSSVSKYSYSFMYIIITIAMFSIGNGISDLHAEVLET